MTTERLTFVGSTGATLAGVLHRPSGGARGSVLLAHCFTCSKDLHTMTRLATAWPAGRRHQVVRSLRGDQRLREAGRLHV